MKGILILCIVIAFFAGQHRALSNEHSARACDNSREDGFFFSFDRQSRECVKSVMGLPEWAKPD
jgi:hypothetical protein